MSEYSFEILTITEQPTLVVRFTARQEELGAKFGEAFPKVFAYTQQTNQPACGMPLARYLGMSPEALEVEAGMPVAEAAKGDGEIVASQLPGGRVAVTWHVGPYDELYSAHEAMNAWLAEQGETAAGGPWEVYATDPGEEPDPAKWKTQIVVPLTSG